MIYKASIKDAENLARLAAAMWIKHSAHELEKEFKSVMDRPGNAFFIAEENNEPAGFAQCSMRSDYVEGTSSCPVGYLEGIFVKEKHRKKGLGAALLKECEKWAKSEGAIEFASDCGIENGESLNFHLRCGFAEVNRVICFAKKLGG